MREFQTVMFGYGGEAAPSDIRQLQAEAAFNAAEAASRMAEQPGKDPAVALAKSEKLLQYIIEFHPDSDWAIQAARVREEVADVAEGETLIR